MSSTREPYLTSARIKKKNPKKVASEGLLLLIILVLVLLFVGSFLAMNHPAASVLYPLRENTQIGSN